MAKALQDIALRGDGIARDIWTRFFQIISEGEVIWDVQNSVGDGVTRKLVPNANYVRPSVTIRADPNNSATILIGFNGSASFPMAANSAITIDWFNPVKNNLCWNDGGHAGQIVYVVG